MKRSLSILIALLLVTCSFAEVWDGSDSSSYADPCNWTPGSVPTGNAIVNDPSPANELILAGTDNFTITSWSVIGQGNVGETKLYIQDNAQFNGAVALFMGNGTSAAGCDASIYMSGNGALNLGSAYLQMGQIADDAGSTFKLDMSDDSSYTGGTIYMGSNYQLSNSTGITNVRNNATVNAAGLLLGHQSGTTGILDIADTTTVNADWCVVGTAAGSTGTATVSGGTTTLVGVLEVGQSGAGTLNMSGGTIDCNDVLVATNAGSSGAINMSGGLITTKTLDLAAVGTLTMNGGQITVLGNDITGDLFFWELLGQFTGAYALVGSDTIITPEPATIAMLAMGGFAALRRRKK